MPKIRGIKHKQAVRVFEKLGFVIARQSGHIIMRKDKQMLVIPRNNPIDPCTMGGIAKVAGLSPDQFKELL